MKVIERSLNDKFIITYDDAAIEVKVIGIFDGVVELEYCNPYRGVTFETEEEYNADCKGRDEMSETFLTRAEIEDVFATGADEYLEGGRIDPSRRLHKRTDLNAFLLLDKLRPGKDDIVSAASHDEFFLSVSLSNLAGKATREDILDLIRCGVRFHDGGFCMFA